MSVNNLANLYGSRPLSEAEPLFRHVLEARERTQGKEHPNTLLSVNNLADLYRPRVAMARPNRFTGAPWRVMSGRWARSILARS